MKKKYIFIIWISLFLMLISVMGTVSAANYTVNPGNSIQSVINNASSNDTIIVNDNNGSAYTYTENMVIDKKLSLQAKSGCNVTVQALNSSLPVLTINSGGSGSIIVGLNIRGSTGNGGIYVNGSVNNTIYQNNITGNLNGLYLNNSTGILVLGNAINNNTANGICLNTGSNNIIHENTLKYNSVNGVSINSSNNNTITTNIITNNIQNGIYLFNSSAKVHFNQIFANTMYGLYNTGNGTVNATNNWWGSNNPTVSSSVGSDICIAGGNVIYDPWLVLNLTGSVIHVTKNSSSDSEITADLTHNNQGEDASSSGALPDGIPINFVTTLGTINGSVTTRRGKAVVKLTSSTNSSAATVSATLDNQTVSKAFRKSFSTIQAAVNDPLTVNGDIIIVGNGTYTENIVINKNLTIISEGNVTVQALIHSVSVFTINSGGSGSFIQGLNISGANSPNCYDHLSPAGILLKSANNCTVFNNTIKNNVYGIYLLDSSYNEIIGNIIENNEQGIIIPNACESLEGWLVSNSNPEGEELQYWINEYYSHFFGIGSNSIFNNITDNKIRNNTYHGVYSTGELSPLGYNQLISNDITGNTIGTFCGYTAAIKAHFNRIAGNNLTGFCMAVGNTDTNVSNNWWGSNNPSMILNSTGDHVNADFCYIARYPGTDYYQYLPSNWILEKFAPFIVLNTRPTSYKVSNGKCDESIITADLNYNLYGECISSKGRVPDGIPVNFSTDNGTITSIGYTKKGTASSNLVLNPNLQSGMTNVTVTLDNQNVSTQVDRISKSIITIISTAIDLSTNQPLNFTYELPLNESVSWVSVLWKANGPGFGNLSQMGIFEAEVDLIVNGEVVVSKNVANAAYLHYKNYSFNPYLFKDINGLNKIFSKTSTSDLSLESLVYLEILLNNSSLDHLKNLTGTQLENALINEFRILNSFTDEEFELLKNHTLFTDFIWVSMSYTGNAGPIIELPSSDENQINELPFNGNYISRLSKITYWNGAYLHLNDNGTYSFKPGGYEGVRSFAIVTTKVTDEILQYWLDQKDKKDINGSLVYPNGPMKAAYGTFLASLLMIKCHDMVADQAASKFNVSWSRTSPIAVSVCDDAYELYMTLECDHSFGMTVTGDPGNVWAFRFACSSAINPIEHWVMKTLFPVANSSSENNSSLASSITIGLGQKILNGEQVDIFWSNGYLVMKSAENNLFLVLDPETGIVRDIMINGLQFFNSAYCFSDQQAEWAFDLGEQLDSSNPSAQPVWLGSIGVISLGTSSVLIEAGVASFEVPVVGWMVGGGLLLAAGLNYLCDQYGWLPPEQCREILGNAFPLTFGTINLFIYGEPPTTLKQLEEACWKAGHLLMAIDENHYEELYDLAKIDINEWRDRMGEEAVKNLENIIGVPNPKDGDKAAYIINLYRDAIKNIKEGAAEFQAGNIKSGTAQFVWGVLEFHMASTYMYSALLPKELQEILPK